VQEKIEFVIENRSFEPKPLMVSINETEIRKAYYQKRLGRNVAVPVSSYDSPQFTALNRKCGTEASNIAKQSYSLKHIMQSPI